MITPRYIPELSAKAFWDVDVNALHFRKDAENIIIDESFDEFMKEARTSKEIKIQERIKKAENLIRQKKK